MAITPSTHPLLLPSNQEGLRNLSKEECTWHACSQASELEGALWKVGPMVGGGGHEGCRTGWPAALTPALTLLCSTGSC